MIPKSNNLMNHLFFFFVICFFWRCASVSPPPPPPPPEPVVVEPKTVLVTPPLPPKKVKVNSVTYNRDQMVIEWEKSTDSDFNRYSLLQAIGAVENPDTIFVTSDINQTTFKLEKFDPTLENWFWIDVINTSGLNTIGMKKRNSIEIKSPKSSRLQTIEGKYDLRIKWTRNRDIDFEKYTIFRSSNEEMKHKHKVKEILQKEDTVQVLSLDSLYFYQIETQDYWGLKSVSNIIKGDYNVQIYGKNYSLVNTKTIDLTKKELFGSIPKEFGKLFNLEVVLLQNNFLSGEIPDEFWNLQKLRILNLSNNQFEGTIPVGIHKLHSLEELWMANNTFNSKIPHQIFSLRNLTHLNLSSNRLSGNISESVSNLKDLRYLNLFDNNFIGSIPIEIGELKNLEFLSFGKNNLTGIIPPEIAGASKLESIALFENHLHGNIPIEVIKLKNLVYLGLFDNQLRGNISNEIFANPNFSFLRLNNNILEKVNYDSLCQSGYNWGNSVYFDISDNDFKEKLPTCFSEKLFYEIYSSIKDK